MASRRGEAVAWIDWFLPRAPRDALRFVRQLTPEDPRFADALRQAADALGIENPISVRSMALDVVGELSRYEQVREVLRQVSRSDRSWRLRAKARATLRRLTGY